MWVVRFDLSAPLSLALEQWPRDVQRAAFKFGSRHHAATYNLSVEDLAVNGISVIARLISQTR